MLSDRLTAEPSEDRIILSSYHHINPKVRRAVGSLSLLIVAAALVSMPSATQSASLSDSFPIEPLPPDVKIETVVPNANQLVAMDFTPDGRLLYTERTGYVRVVKNDQLLPTPAYIFLPGDIDTQGERGLLGIAVDPSFSSNHLVWVYVTRRVDINPSRYRNRVVQFALADNNQVLTSTRAASFPVDPYVTIHNGGNLHFGPDGKLYVTVGNNDETNGAADPAQNLASPLGKIHRFDPTVPLSVPGGNPFGNSSIFARGLRNSFDFTFDPISGALFATENGEACDDEINRILPGGDYGWRPFYPCDDEAPNGPDLNYNTIPPLIYWTSSLAPTGITFYTGDSIPEWKNDLFICSFKDATTGIHHFKLNAQRTAIVSHTILSDGVTHQLIKCRTDLLTGPDGALYFSYGGGYPAYNGPIKRLIRRTSFASTTVSPSPLNPAPGGQVSYTLNVRHLGDLSNTFALTVDVPSSAVVIDAQSPNGTLSFLSSAIWWSGTLTGIETWTATYQLQIASEPTTSYPLTNTIRLTARNVQPIVLTPTVFVNGYLIYLPIGVRAG